MERRKCSRAFKLEAVKLVKDRGVTSAEASRDPAGLQHGRRHSTIGYLSPVEFERKAGSA